MRKESVTIVIANHNYSRYLGEAIESALSQDYSAIEVIVVDDGSVDESLEIACRYPVRVYAQPNMGVCAARNNGAHLSNGDYLVFLDSDDVLQPDYVNACLSALKEAGPDVAYVYTQMEYFGDRQGYFQSRPWSAEAFRRQNYVNVSALMQKHAFLEIGGFDRGIQSSAEDYELFLRYLKYGHKGCLVEKPLLRYRKHGESRNSKKGVNLLYSKCLMRTLYPELVDEPHRYIWWKISKKRIKYLVTGMFLRKREILAQLQANPHQALFGPTYDSMPVLVSETQVIPK